MRLSPMNPPPCWTPATPFSLLIHSSLRPIDNSYSSLTTSSSPPAAKTSSGCTTPPSPTAAPMRFKNIWSTSANAVPVLSNRLAHPPGPHLAQARPAGPRVCRTVLAARLLLVRLCCRRATGGLPTGPAPAARHGNRRAAHDIPSGLPAGHTADLQCTRSRSHRRRPADHHHPGRTTLHPHH